MAQPRRAAREDGLDPLIGLDVPDGLELGLDPAELEGLVTAAGGLVWREDEGQLRLAVIHRPRQDDWSLPKGKLLDGETFAEAALREVAEETGWETRLAGFAGHALYRWRGRSKLVLYWHMRAIGEGRFRPSREVDRLDWLKPQKALDRLDRRSDRELVKRALRDRRSALRLA
ncbi:MAG: NUDIX hydrolase [Anaeromyxobacter sp.]